MYAHNKEDKRKEFIITHMHSTLDIFSQGLNPVWACLLPLATWFICCWVLFFFPLTIYFLFPEDSKARGCAPAAC